MTAIRVKPFTGIVSRKDAVLADTLAKKVKEKALLKSSTVRFGGTFLDFQKGRTET